LSDSVKRGENGVFYSLLPLFDFMDLFLSNNNPSDNNFKFLFNELNSLKSKYGLVRIGEEGEAFNPDIHSALESEDGSGIISKIYSYGYARDGVILRVAMVGVK
jgi:molecular chaperone GrpE